MNPFINLCPCHGQGFILTSENGEWVRCDFHGKDVPSPYSPNQGEVAAQLKAIMAVQEWSGLDAEAFFNRVYCNVEFTLGVKELLNRSVDLAVEIHYEKMEADNQTDPDRRWENVNQSSFAYDEDFGY